jgi:hypothetical protein
VVHSQDQVSRILEKLRLARLSDPEFEVFGASAHRYIVHPPASEEAILRFEKQHAIALPDAYKSFLLHVGNGGVGFSGSAAGPFYGIYPFGTGLDDIPTDTSGAALAKPCVVSPRMSEEDWALLASGLGFDSDLADKAYEAAVCTLFGGLLPIGTQGCTYIHCLVVNGPLAGRVVNVDLEYSRPPVFAHEPDFLAWYERWLDEVISGDLQQTSSWFGYVKGGSEMQLLAGLQACGDLREEREFLEGLLSKRSLAHATLLDLAQFYSDREEHRSTICRIVCKSDYAMAKPLLSDLGQREPLAFFQCLHWYARDRVTEWEHLILTCAEKIDDEETFRFFTYVLEPLRVDRGAHLAPYTRSPNTGIRVQALYALGNIEDKQRFLDCFIEGLNDTATETVRTALQALAGVRTPSILPHYQRLLGRFPVEQDYVLSNLDQRLAEFGLSRESLRGAS